MSMLTYSFRLDKYNYICIQYIHLIFLCSDCKFYLINKIHWQYIINTSLNTLNKCLKLIVLHK
jgi:hypothetical protein